MATANPTLFSSDQTIKRGEKQNPAFCTKFPSSFGATSFPQPTQPKARQAEKTVILGGLHVCGVRAKQKVSGTPE